MSNDNTEHGILTRCEAKKRRQVWFKGELCTFTGKVERIYGGIFGEAKAHATGKIVLIALRDDREHPKPRPRRRIVTPRVG